MHKLAGGRESAKLADASQINRYTSLDTVPPPVLPAAAAAAAAVVGRILLLSVVV
jgi:hypothetical protein